ncbi:hypothetical protein N0V94_003971 [Neodidymelliopsis sp. IMI 364377]|nr:hypothetical protein N0V94_003971 [Neodidymelliopsis sp. IMI 364377]
MPQPRSAPATMDRQAPPPDTVALPVLALSTVAKFITRFLFDEAQVPSFLSQHAVFFAGLATGLAASPVLHAYLSRCKCDRAKIQLAVFHVMRLLDHQADREALLQEPQKVLTEMDKEVTRMLNQHLSQAEATEVRKELKRKVEQQADEQQKSKRMRETKQAAVQDQVRVSPTPRHLPGHFSSSSEVDQDHAQRTAYNNHSLAQLEPQHHTVRDTFISPVQHDDHHGQHMLLSDGFIQEQLRDEEKQYTQESSDPAVPSSPPIHQFYKTSQWFSYNRASAPSPESSPAPAGCLSSPTPNVQKNGESDQDIDMLDASFDMETHATEVPKTPAKKDKGPVAPRSGGYGFDYDGDLYSSSSSNDSFPDDLSQSLPTKNATGKESNCTAANPVVEVDDIEQSSPSKRSSKTFGKPPTVVAKVYGVRSCGKSLSPIPEAEDNSLSVYEDDADGTNVQNATPTLIQNDPGSSPWQLPSPSIREVTAKWSKSCVEYCSDDDETGTVRSASPNQAIAVPYSSPALSTTLSTASHSRSSKPLERSAAIATPLSTAQAQTINIVNINITTPPQQEQSPPPPEHHAATTLTQSTTPPRKSPPRSPLSPTPGNTSPTRTLWPREDPCPPKSSKSPSKKRKSPSSSSIPSVSPSSSPKNSTPLLKRGRGRGPSRATAESIATPQPRGQKSAQTPGTRKSVRKGGFSGVYGK